VARSAIAHFLFVSCYPFWSLTAIALDMFRDAGVGRLWPRAPRRHRMTGFLDRATDNHKEAPWPSDQCS
jgi:hypothetical protein